MYSWELLKVILHYLELIFRPEDFESQFSAIPGTSFVGRRSLKNDAFFFLIGTSERHTATSLVNFKS